MTHAPNSKPVIVFLESGSIPATLRRPAFDHVWREYVGVAEGDIESHLVDADILIVNKMPIRAALLSRLPKLKLIAVSATGADNVDLDWCREHGVVVSNIRGYAAHTVPEHVMMLALALSRNLPAYRSAVEAGGWQRTRNFCLLDAPIRDLHGGVMTLVGRGSIGQGVARLAEAFGMQVLFAEHRAQSVVREGYVPFDEGLARADVVSLHCPLTAATHHLIGERELNLMKQDALLINTSRGALVDDVALLKALQSGRLGGAGLDVLPKEPPTEGHPLLDVRLPNLIVTPHVAWGSQAARQALADQLIDNIEAWMRGEPRNRLA
ncbi:MAG: hypothetical protein RIR70_1582 [Pseudomonadota bacterium]|jgi:glycerate dehydrogenase